MTSEWINDDRAALFTDLYQLTMLQAYQREGMHGEAVFELFVRRLVDRNYVVVAGIDTILHYLETLHFNEEAIDYLRSLDRFDEAFLDDLRNFRFTGSVLAMQEGTAAFADEPIMQIIAPISQAQLVETFVLNQITFQTNAATKASRVVQAAGESSVVDFGARRMHGTDASIKAARAYYIAGVSGTSNVAAGMIYGLPVSGTMAHSYIQAHDDEDAALLAFAREYPGTTLLVDTYDTLAAVRRLTMLANEYDAIRNIGAIRLDSGDLAELARESRQILDDGGLSHVRIVASGSLDEYRVRDIVRSGAPIDAFGVGTSMGTIADRPFLDSAYKLVSYDGRPRMKLAEAKANLPGLKQVFRVGEGARTSHDVVGLVDEPPIGVPLLRRLMQGGKRTAAGDGMRDLDAARNRASEGLSALDSRFLELETADQPFRVEVSRALEKLAAQVRSEHAR
jgi:nicotinate phosphoribosyltransferase